MKRKTPAAYERWMRSTLYFAFNEGWYGLQRVGMLPDQCAVYADDEPMLPLRLEKPVRQKIERLAYRADNASMRRMSREDAILTSCAALLLTAEHLLQARDVPEAAYHAHKLQEHRSDLALLRDYSVVEPVNWLEKKADNAFQSARGKGKAKEIPADLGKRFNAYVAKRKDKTNPARGVLTSLALHYGVAPGTVRTWLEKIGKSR